MPIFQDRRDAGKKLAQALEQYAEQDDVLVLALPRGGVPVAYEVAKALDAPLDLFLVRKLGVPGHAELAMGAIASGGVRVLNREIVRGLNISEEAIESVAEQERQELRRREQAYRGDRSEPKVEGQTAILIDDGLATGATMRAAVEALREQGPARIVVAVPTASPDVCESFRSRADEVVCVATPQPFYAVGASYAQFSQTTDDEVREYLRLARRQGLTT